MKEFCNPKVKVYLVSYSNITGHDSNTIGNNVKINHVCQNNTLGITGVRSYLLILLVVALLLVVSRSLIITVALSISRILVVITIVVAPLIVAALVIVALVVILVISWIVALYESHKRVRH